MGGCGPDKPAINYYNATSGSSYNAYYCEMYDETNPCVGSECAPVFSDDGSSNGLPTWALVLIIIAAACVVCCCCIGLCFFVALRQDGATMTKTINGQTTTYVR